MIGTTILHFEILELLGRGAMGTVYKARDTRLDTFRTLKFLHPVLSEDPSSRRHLMREARTQARLIHPNISTLMALEEFEGQVFLVLQFVDGVTLDRYLEKYNPSTEERFSLILQIACALEAAHQLDIVHRDIKSRNVLVDTKGVAKVTDFGLAKSGGRSSLSMSGEIKGTVAYMPPEAFRGEPPGKAGDIWALGVLAYEILEGRLTFPGENIESATYQIVNEPHPPLSEKVAKRLPGMAEFIDRCLEKDHTRRLKDGPAACALLETIGWSTGITTALPVSVRNQLLRRRAGRIGRWALHTAIVAAILLVLFTLFGRRKSPYAIPGPGWVYSTSYGGLTWNGSGTSLAFFDLISESTSNEIIIRSISNPSDHLGVHRIEIPGRIYELQWCPTDSIIAVTASDGTYLYLISPKRTTKILDESYYAISWSAGGDKLAYTKNTLEESHEIGIVTVMRDGAMSDTWHADTHPLAIESPRGRYYFPIFILDDTMLAFVICDGAQHKGVWVVPVEGGIAQPLERRKENSSADLLAWNLGWDEKNRLLFFNKREDTGCYFVKLDRDGRSSNHPVLLPIPGVVSDLDFSPASGKLALFNHRIDWCLGRYPFDQAGRIDNSRTFERVLQTSDHALLYQLFPPVIAGQTGSLIFPALTARGVGLWSYSPGIGTPEVVIQGEGVEFEQMLHPDVHPSGDKDRLLFLGRVGGFDYLAVLENGRTTRLSTSDEFPLYPSWAPDGNSIFYVRTEHQRRGGPRDEIVRATLVRDPQHLMISERQIILRADQVPTSRILKPWADRTGRYLLFSGSGDSLFVADTETGQTRYLTSGRSFVLDSSRWNVYFLRPTPTGLHLYCIRDWVRSRSDQASEIESIATLNQNTRSLALSQNALWILLEESSGRDLLLYDIVR